MAPIAPAMPPSLATVVPPMAGAPVAVPRAGGRTWYCRWCGMESEASDKCSWCRKDLRNLPSSGQQGRGPIISGRPTGKQKPAGKGKGQQPQPQAVPTPAPASPPPPAPVPKASQPAQPQPPKQQQPKPKSADVGIPEMTRVQTTKSKYYQDQVVDQVSGTQYDADTGEVAGKPVVTVEGMAEEERGQLVRSITLYSGALAAAVIVGTLLTHFMPSWYLLFLALVTFAAGMALPLFGVAQYGEDDSTDVGWFVGFAGIGGPFVGGIAYGVLGLIKGDANPALAGIFIVSLLARIPLDMAKGTPIGASLNGLMPFTDPTNAIHWAAQLMTFLGLVGWYFAGMFHKLDE